MSFVRDDVRDVVIRRHVITFEEKSKSEFRYVERTQKSSTSCSPLRRAKM
jgi:hypothetical protein